MLVLVATFNGNPSATIICYSPTNVVGLWQEMIVALGLGLPLKVATIILGSIFSMLSSDFRACGPISIPTPPVVALTEFFHTDAVASIHPLAES